MTLSALETACRLYQQEAKTNPFNTWLIVENEDVRRRAAELIASPVLDTRITTIKTLAHTILKEQNANIRIIPPEEQFLLFLAFAKEVFDKKTATKTLTENLIDLYITLILNQKPCPTDTEKGRKAAEVFNLYTKWCKDSQAADAISAIQYAVPYAEKMKPETCICCCLQSTTPLAETLLSVFAPEALHLQPKEPELTLPECETAVLSYKNTREEISQTLETICRLEESGVPGKDILVLTPSLRTTLPVFEELTAGFYVDRKIPLTFKTAERKSILNIPAVRAVLSWVSASFDPKETDISLILESPYLRINRQNITAGKLRKAIKRAGDDNVSHLRDRLAEGDDETIPAVVEEILQFAQRRQKSARTLRERIAALEADLRDLGWMQAEMTESESRARQAFCSLLERLAASGTADTSCSPTEFSAILARGCRKNAGIPYPENETAFRIGKLRSAAGTRTPYVFIIGLSAKNIPNISATLPLLTVQETKNLLPDRYKKSAGDTAYYFAEAVHSAETQLTLSYAESTGKNSESPSPYLTSLAEPQAAQPLPLLHAVFGNQKIAGHLIAERKKPEDIFGIRDLEDTAYRIQVETICRKEPGEYTAHFTRDFRTIYAEKHVSPTFLETYAECPFAWYIRYHLGLENPKDASAESIRIGTVFHNVLERYFREHPCITEDMRESAFAELSELLVEEMQKTGIKTPSWEAYARGYLGKDQLSSSLQELIETEIGFTEAGYRTEPEWLERDVTAVFDGITVTGRVDRVMKKDDRIRVVDYKTGKVKEKKDVKNGTALQLPIYTEAAAKETGLRPETGYYVQTSSRKAGVVQIFEDDAEKMIADAKEMIVSIIERIRNGECAVTEKCGNKYCPYKHICRKDEGGQND